jgi:hypothetical protein
MMLPAPRSRPILLYWNVFSAWPGLRNIEPVASANDANNIWE